MGIDFLPSGEPVPNNSHIPEASTKHENRFSASAILIETPLSL